MILNSDISAWDISNVMTSGMFNNALSFNGDISSWDVSSVTNMNSMFENAESFSRIFLIGMFLVLGIWGKCLLELSASKAIYQIGMFLM